jgi:hypothetical protein
MTTSQPAAIPALLVTGKQNVIAAKTKTIRMTPARLKIFPPLNF